MVLVGRLDDRCESSARSFLLRKQLIRILQPPLQNHMFSQEKRGFGDNSGDSLDDSLKCFWGPRQRTRR
jgi:hypothetical protein